MTEYLAVLDDAASGAATEVTPSSYRRPTRCALDGSYGWPSLLSYCDNYLIDVEHAVIVDVEATMAVRPAGGGATQTMLTRTTERLGLWPERLIAGTGYGSAAMLDCLVHEQGIESYIPMFDRLICKDGTFSRADFTCDHRRDLYVCLDGKELRHCRRQLQQPRIGVGAEGIMRYRATTRDCGPCSYKEHCCPKHLARKVLRSIHEDARDLARSIAEMKPYVV